jgi:hypothetical protein
MHIVVTWGFMPDVQVRCVTFMRSPGFDWVWLDGDRDAAHRIFTARATVSAEAWRTQIGKVSPGNEEEAAGLLDAYLSRAMTG